MKLTNDLNLLKFNDSYFLPLDWINYMEIMIVVFFIGILILIFPNFWMIGLLTFVLYIFSFINNRKFIVIENQLSKHQNIHLINELALRQQNCSKFLENNGLFMFEYVIPKTVNYGRFKQRNHSETIIIISDQNKILISSYHSNFFLKFIKSTNFKNWKQLIKIKSDSL